MKKLLDMYLMREESEPCAHCKSGAPMKGKTVCSKCSKELESFRNKKNKDKDDGNEG